MNSFLFLFIQYQTSDKRSSLGSPMYIICSSYYLEVLENTCSV